MLLTPQVMAYPDFEKPFVLHVDASLDGLGAILYQQQSDGKLSVIAYASRTLSEAEKKYHSGKLEFLALKWALSERFRDYLFYAPNCTIYSDNNPLQYLMTSAKLDATRMRWVSDLAGFRFVIHYKPGNRNQDADGLSRMPLNVDNFSLDMSSVEVKTAVNCVTAGQTGGVHWVNTIKTMLSENEVTVSPDVQATPVSPSDLREAQQNDPGNAP